METVLEQNPLCLFPAFRAVISPALLKYWREDTEQHVCRGISRAGTGRGPREKRAGSELYGRGRGHTKSSKVRLMGSDFLKDNKEPFMYL